MAANTALGSDDASYDIYSTEMVDDKTATVALTITTADGSIDDRTTLLVYENNGWKHELTQREYDLFAGATAPAPASANGSPNRNAPKPSASEDCISEGKLRSQLGQPATGMETDVRVRGRSVPPLTSLLFSKKVRAETDLDALHAELVGMARETMQLAHVSLWLRSGTPPKDSGGRK